MRYFLATALLASCLTACLDPKIEDPESRLDFFYFDTTWVEPELELGTVVVHSALTFKAETEIEEHGFLWAKTRAAVEGPTEEAMKHAVDGPPPYSFNYQINNLTPDTTYYFRAYAKARAGSLERWIYSEIKPYNFDIALNISRAVDIDNDSVILSADILSLEERGIRVSEYGFVWSQTNSMPKWEEDSTRSLDGLLNSDRRFSTTIQSLDFDTRYFARAFVKPEDGDPYYSDTLSFRIADGWRPDAELPFPLHDAGSATLGNKGYVTLGCKNQSCTIPNDQLLEYEPGQGWSTVATFPSTGFYRRNHTTFLLGDTLYVGFGSRAGQQAYLRNFWWIALNGSREWMKLEEEPPFEMLGREGAVAFVIKGNAYLGTGTTANGVLNDFWQFCPGCPEALRWRRVADMPRKQQLQTGAVILTENRGRHDAVAFVIDNKGYVGSGRDIGYIMNDFWEFTPPEDPEDPDDPGSWNYDPFLDLPGTPRFDAVSFVLNEKAYFGAGLNYQFNFYLGDFWEFDPDRGGESAWKAVNHLRGEGRDKAFGFAIDGKGYVGGGEDRALNDNSGTFDSFPLKNFWAYTPQQ